MQIALNEVWSSSYLTELKIGAAVEARGRSGRDIASNEALGGPSGGGGSLVIGTLAFLGASNVPVSIPNG